MDNVVLVLMVIQKISGYMVVGLVEDAVISLKRVGSVKDRAVLVNDMLMLLCVLMGILVLPVLNLDGKIVTQVDNAHPPSVHITNIHLIVWML